LTVQLKEYSAHVNSFNFNLTKIPTKKYSYEYKLYAMFKGNNSYNQYKKN